MKNVFVLAAGFAALGLVACGQSTSSTESSASNSETSAPTAQPAASVDEEFEALKAVKAPDACALLTPEKLKVVYPDLTFEVHQNIAPQMSGYVWDSRCVYWAGVGTVEFAKDAPTHTVELFIATSATPSRAQKNLASRREMAAGNSNFQAQAALGSDAHTTTDTGVAHLFFVKDQSEIQINISSLNAPNAQKVEEALALGKSL